MGVCGGSTGFKKIPVISPSHLVVSTRSPIVRESSLSNFPSQHEIVSDHVDEEEVPGDVVVVEEKRRKQ